MSARPSWLKVPVRATENFDLLTERFNEKRLSTVCHQSACPNIWECFARREATFLLLGKVCTRACSYCRIAAGPPDAVDPAEPDRLASAVAELNLAHVVLTSVTRDDLEDGGAAVFAEAIDKIRAAPDCHIEVLLPDFQGDRRALDAVVRARPDVLGHNLETVRRLFPAARPQADYDRSLKLLGRLADRGLNVKSGIMLGLGESRAEVRQTLSDLSAAGVKWVTIGQYLPPSPRHHPVIKYYRPEEFMGLAKYARRLGFRRIISGPMVRSSYRPHPV